MGPGKRQRKLILLPAFCQFYILELNSLAQKLKILKVMTSSLIQFHQHYKNPSHLFLFNIFLKSFLKEFAASKLADIFSPCISNLLIPRRDLNLYNHPLLGTNDSLPPSLLFKCNAFSQSKDLISVAQLIVFVKTNNINHLLKVHFWVSSSFSDVYSRLHYI